MTADLRTKLMQKRSLRAAVNAEREGNPLALLKEIAMVTRATTRLTALRIPLAVGKSLWSDPAIDGAGNAARTLEVLGSVLLEYINDLGPIYGKAGQILLSRLDPERQELAAKLQLDRLYGQWPAMGIDQVLEIMDRDAPEWRKYLKRIETMPLGIASISQVHAATDHEGNDWVVKVIKPDAHKRLSETVDAMEQILAVLEPLTVTRATKKAVGEAKELCESYRGELSLRRELDTIQRVRSGANKSFYAFLACSRNALRIVFSWSSAFTGFYCLTSSVDMPPSILRGARCLPERFCRICSSRFLSWGYFMRIPMPVT